MAKIPLMFSIYLLGAFLGAQSEVFLENKEASAVLQRQRRANSNRLEEVIPGNLERECIEEKCSYEEAREVFENTEKTMEFWKMYIDGDQCDPNPCKNGAICKDGVGSYVCWCPAGYEGRNCEIDFTCSIKNGGCKHFCRHDPPHKVVCSCAAGYKLHEDGKSCEPAVPYPCGRITAPEAKSKLTRAINTLDNWNTTYDDLDDVSDEDLNNITETTTAATTRIVPIVKTGTRVVGGSDSMRGEVPWQIYDNLYYQSLYDIYRVWLILLYPTPYPTGDIVTVLTRRGITSEVYLVNSHNVGFCGGSIINERWVVTAAHCLQPGDNVTAVAGEYNTRAEDATEQRRRVVRIVPHPTYNATLHKHHNDIALLELDEPLRFNSYVTPICLGSREFTAKLLKYGMGTVSGWGSLFYRGREATILQVLRVPFVDRPTCLKSTSITIELNMFCAGYSAGGRDTCEGDSGGPFTTEFEGTWFLTGITSWGEECAKPGKYGIYTKVSKYIKWIKDTTRLA